MSFLRRGWAKLSGRINPLIRLGLVLFFVWLVGRFWSPYYGFTKLLQLATTSETKMLPVLRTAPIYVHQDEGSYDGQYYAQLSASPALRDPALPASIDNLGYRARRMLLSWIAWIAGLGDPAGAVFAYAWLNVLCWFVFGALLWRRLPPVGWRSTVAWVGLLFASGTLYSVRCALTDLAALTLLAGGLWQLERGRGGQGLGWLSVAALARETSVLGLAALLPGVDSDQRGWRRAGGRALLAILPLAVWLLYIKMAVGESGAGQRNFDWPLVGFVTKWRDVFIALQFETDRWLSVSSVLVQLALTVQLLYLTVRPQRNDAWWRVGAAYAVLLLFLGPAVWEGTPGAATRVLLPLSLAFNVLAVRARASAVWLALGNLAVLSGILALWDVPSNPGEVATLRAGGHRYLLEADSRWYTPESRSGARWSWCGQNGRLTLHTWPVEERVKIQLHLQGYSTREMEIWHAGKVVWHGLLAAKLQWVELPELATEKGNLRLELRSNVPPFRGADGRDLGFVCYGFKVQ